nr:TA system VapC family ribonuclease toxin [Rhodoferax sp.]
MTPDVNVLIAAFREEHTHHAKARAWLLDACAQSAAASAALRLMPLVMASFLRLVTNPRVFATPATTQQAIAFLDAVLVNPGVSILDTSAPWPELRKMCLEKNLSANALPDAMIAATVSHCKEVLTSFDRDFLRLLPKHQLQLLVN